MQHIKEMIFMKRACMCALVILIFLMQTAFAAMYDELVAYVVPFVIKTNNKLVDIEDDVVIINDKTYVPLRTISEMLNCNVEWDDETKTISIDIIKNENELYPFRSGNKYGYIDKYGEIIIKPQFDYAAEFSEGLACVGKSKGKEWGASGLSEMVYGYINTTGTLVIPYINERERDFHNSFVCAWALGSNLCYIMNNQGENAFDKVYYDIKDFSDGYAAVLLNDTAPNPHRAPIKESQQWTFINSEGKECGEIYTSVTSFVNGISIVEKDGFKKAINTSFETVFQSEYILQSYNGNGRYTAKNPITGKLGVIDENNNVIIDFQYSYIHYSDNMYKVGLNDNTYGIINEYGDIILEAKPNQFVSDYKAGMSVIDNDNSVIDRQGNVIMAANKYDAIVPCTGNLLYVYKKEDDRYYEGYIDIYGNVLIMNETTY